MRKPGKNIDGIVTGRKDILNELISCKENGTAIAVWAPTLNKGLSIYYVKEIRVGASENDMVIILQENDLKGKTLETRVVYLKEIEKVHVLGNKPERKQNQ
jgi:hypothetical protein